MLDIFLDKMDFSADTVLVAVFVCIAAYSAWILRGAVAKVDNISTKVDGIDNDMSQLREEIGRDFAQNAIDHKNLGDKVESYRKETDDSISRVHTKIDNFVINLLYDKSGKPSS